MEVEEYSWGKQNQRINFQGQERDEETGWDNYKYRMHNPKIGRFFSRDPLAPKFAHNSPYAFSENRVVDGLELEGLEVYVIGKNASGGGWVKAGFEGGFVIAPDGVYGFGTPSIGLQTGWSVSGMISITTFPTMPTAESFAAHGFNVNVSAGEAVQWSAGVAIAYGEQTYFGYNFQFGFGAGAKFFGADAGYGYTLLQEFKSKADLQEALTGLNEYHSIAEKTVTAQEYKIKLQDKKIEYNNLQRQVNKEKIAIMKEGLVKFKGMLSAEKIKEVQGKIVALQESNNQLINEEVDLQEELVDLKDDLKDMQEMEKVVSDAKTQVQQKLDKLENQE